MMSSAAPKLRVLIVGAKFGEMYLNALCSPRRGWNWLVFCPRGSARSRAGLCVWNPAVYLAGTDRRDAGYRLYRRALNRRRRERNPACPALF